MMKLGEASNRLSRVNVAPPPGVDWVLLVANRNFLIHQYDQIDRSQSWLTLSSDLPTIALALEPCFREAIAVIDGANSAQSG